MPTDNAAAALRLEPFLRPPHDEFPVGYKRVVDFNVRTQVELDGSGVVAEGVRLRRHPVGDIALEEALRLRAVAPPTKWWWPPPPRPADVELGGDRLNVLPELEAAL